MQPLVRQHPSGLGLKGSSLRVRKNALISSKPTGLRVAAVFKPGTPVPSSLPNAPSKQRGELQKVAGVAADYPYDPQSFGGPDSSGRLGEAARQSLAKATAAMNRYGWIGFWVQLTLSVVSGVILLFSVAFTSQSGPKASLYLTVVGILAGFLSTFWNYGYQRTATRMQEYLDGANVAKVKKQQVMELITRGILINIVGMGSTLIGISTLVGLLVAKTLSNASVNPFMASAAAGYNPVLALDVFLVQAATNTLLGHFLSLICALWLLNVVGEGRGLRFQRQQHMQKIKENDGPNGSSLISGTVKGFAGVYDIPKAPGKGVFGGQGRSGGQDTFRKRATAVGGSSSSNSGGSRRGLGSSGLPSAKPFAGDSYSNSSSSMNTMGYVSSSSSAGRRTAGMPVVAATLAAAAPTDSSDSSSSRSDALLLPPAAVAATTVAPAVAATTVAPAVAATTVAPAAAFAAWLARVPSWQAAARPAAAAAAATAKALAAADLPAPPVRAPKLPEQRLMQDFLLMPTEASLEYLDGSLPGDFGFDPLGLFDPAVTSRQEREWLVTAEVMHGRWAMLGGVGCLVPEMLGQKPFYETGWLPPAGSTTYWTDNYTLAAIALILMGSVEYFRWRDYKQPGSMGEKLQFLLPQSRPDLAGGFSGSGSPAYPSGVFNYFRAVVSGPAVAQYKEAEIRHSRLAMLAMVGFGAQAVLTGQGPWANLAAHLHSPLGANILTSFGSIFGQ